MEEKIKQEPTQEEMIQLLSQTIIQQDKRIKEAEEALTKTQEELNLAMKENSELKEEYAKPMAMPVIDKEDIIQDYLNKELKYAETKVKELRYHLADYPEDEYSKVDLQNCLLHINYLRAALRRLYL
jgi:hypothetical protein